MSLNLKQVKGNFQRLFDKNLTDLVRGLRNNKDNEVNEVSPMSYFANFHSHIKYHFTRSSTSALFA